jgi:hypothetical protein
MRATPEPGRPDAAADPHQVLLAIMLAFTMLLAFVIHQSQGAGDREKALAEELDAARGENRALQEALERLEHTPAGQIARGEREAQEDAQRSRLENVWLRELPRRLLKQRLKELGTGEHVRLAADRGHLPADERFSEVCQEVARLYGSAEEPEGVAPAEVEALVVHCCREWSRERGCPDPAEGFARRIAAACRDRKRDFLFLPEVPSYCNLRHLADVVRKDLLQERGEVVALQHGLVFRIARARVEDAPGAADQDDPREILRSLIGELRQALCLLPEGVRDLLVPSPDLRPALGRASLP